MTKPCTMEVAHSDEGLRNIPGILDQKHNEVSLKIKSNFLF